MMTRQEAIQELNRLQVLGGFEFAAKEYKEPDLDVERCIRANRDWLAMRGIDTP